MSTLYIEPFGGLAGDMFLAALIDLEHPDFGLDCLVEMAGSLLPGECSLVVEETDRRGLRARLLSVRTPESARPPHRHLDDLLALLERPPMSREARDRAARVLRRIAEAEGRVHGLPPGEVHFHEVGAVDTLIDVAGAALALERLGVERIHADPPLVGEGHVDCAHGRMPVPAPGTAEILRGLPSILGGGMGERLTPTGAALLAEFVDSFEPPGNFTASLAGYGAGMRDPEDGPPNLVRVQLGERAPGPGSGAGAQAWLLEFNLDDATGEEVGFCLEELRSAGALEAWLVPVQMKKSRPGGVVSALCRSGRRAALEAVAFDHSPTLGLRWSPCQRTECAREVLRVDLRGASLRVVRRIRPGVPARAIDLSPEYDDLAALARATGEPLRSLEREAVEQALADLGGGE